MNYNITDKIILKSDITDNIVREALRETISAYLSFYNVKVEDISKIFRNSEIKTRTDQNAILVYHLFQQLLDKNDIGHKLIEFSFEINQANYSRALGDRIKDFFAKYDIDFIKNSTKPIMNGFSVFLLILHFKKIIHLPFNFNIPYTFQESGYKNYQKRVDFGISIYPPMFKALRSIDIRHDEDDDSKIMGCKNKELLVSYGSKAFIALGWVDFQDATIKCVEDFDNAIKKIDLKRFKTSPPYSLMIYFFNHKFPKEFPISIDDWKIIVQKSKNIKIKAVKKYPPKIKKLTKSQDFSSVISLIDEPEYKLCLKGINLRHFNVQTLDKLSAKLKDYSEIINHWKILQDSYIKKRKLENYQTIKLSLTYFNIYLFLILPRWYKTNESKITYPRTANELKAGIFISKLIQSSDPMPPSLCEFLEDIQKVKDLKNEYIYVILKNLEGFFNFIQTYADELPGCKGFKQPISSLDLPKITKSKGTNKGLIPRYLFGHLISYIETIQNYNNIILKQVLDGKLDTSVFKKNDRSYLDYIDTAALEASVGSLPTICVNNKDIVLKDIPNLLNIKNVMLQDGRNLALPHPHLLNHILIILQTGLRSNHIQWLDAKTYRCAIKEDNQNVFVPLYVNTDKSKSQAWTPLVSQKVIDLLDAQLEWRNLIASPGFNEKKFYNNNPNTKWGSFYPIFSYTPNGLPYNDTHYYEAWMTILESFQIFLKQTDLKPIELGRRLPKSISFNDFNLDAKLQEYGSKCEKVCDLRYSTDITPHSARVSIVSHYITALPADLIGQYITGQTEAVVHHYVKLDADYLTGIERGQKDGLAKIAIDKEFNQLTDKQKVHPILADREDSHLAQSMAINKTQTISHYGCISLNLKEEGKSGLDILIENSNIKIAYNKTEICPYNNNCPADLIKELKGIRRCGICPYAVRSIDHLPAIAVKKRQTMELLEEIENRLEGLDSKTTQSEVDIIEYERQKITEELLGWIMSEEILEHNRKELKHKDFYVVKKPEILIEQLERVSVQEGDVQYLLTRLNDCQTYPQLDSPFIKAKIELLRRQLLAKLGKLKEAFDLKIPVNPVQECSGLLREVVKRFDLTHEQTLSILAGTETDDKKTIQLLGLNDDR